MPATYLSRNAHNLLTQLYYLCKTEIGDCYDPKYADRNGLPPKEHFTNPTFSEFINMERFVYGNAKSALTTFEQAIKELYVRSCIDIENETFWHWVQNPFKWKERPRAMLHLAIEELKDRQQDGFNYELDKHLRALIEDKYRALAQTKICITNWGVMCARPRKAVIAPVSIEDLDVC